MNNYHEFLRSRHSIRRFKPDLVPATVMDRILSTATFAPSAHNLQPWRFVHVESTDAKTRLGNALTEKMRADMQSENADPAEIHKRTEISLRRVAEAPCIILLCRDKTDVRKDDVEEDHMNIQSTALLGLQLMLAAHAEGLGANWICWPLYAQPETQDALNLPDAWLPEALFFLGYPAEEGNSKERDSVKQLIVSR
jgi:coenzyme F420-0:L-glutamate ligase/coenzyme F420-1:gamma-L-glutamate ligase